MFRVGDLVTGTDRRYARSIYRIESLIDDERGMYRIVSLSGRVYPKDLENGLFENKHDGFRLATNMEIKISSDSNHTRYCLIRLLSNLGICAAARTFHGFV